VNARVSSLSVALLFFSLGCGPSIKKDALAIPAASRQDGGAPSWVVTPPPSGLPPFAPMPPPGVVGSKKARAKRDPSWLACHTSVRPSRDLAAEVSARGKACEKATKMHPVGAVLKGTQGAGDPHQEFPLRAEAKHCYRVYLAADDQVVDVGILVRDSSGDVAGEDAGLVLLEDGGVCFDAADDAKVIVTVGGGKGSYALQVWSD
jgi:hypothetical protein